MKEEEYRQRKRLIENQQQEIDSEKRNFLNYVSQIYNLTAHVLSQNSNQDNTRIFQRQLNEIRDMGLKKCKAGQQQLLQEMEDLKREYKDDEKEGNDC